MSGPAPSIQYSWDGPGTLGAGQDALYLRWNNATGAFEMASAGVSDHGGLTGLGDDDHSQYVLLAPAASARNVIRAANSSTIPLIVRLFSGSTQDLIAVQNAAGTNMFRVDWQGNVTLATNLSSSTSGFTVTAPAGSYTLKGSSSATLYTVSASTGAHVFTPISAAAVVMAVRGAASQTANLQEWQNSAGTVLAYVAASGQIVASNGLSCATFTNSGSIQAGSGGSFLKAADGANKVEWNATGIGFFAVTPVARPTALTAADASALNTGDATSDTVIGNMRTRIGELESKLQALGLLT